MATLYDFPLDLLDEDANARILSNSSTMNTVLIGYKAYIVKCNSSDEKAKNIVKMMDFFASTGICVRTKMAADLKYADNVDAPKYKVTAGFANFPLDAFLGRIKEYLKGGSKSATVAKTVNPSSVVAKKATETKEIAVSTSGAISISKQGLGPGSFYYEYHSAPSSVEKDLLLAQKLLVIHERAKLRKLECTLTMRDLKTIFRRKRCYYTNVLFDQSSPDLAPTLDRVDPNVGYIPGNVVLCTLWSNNFKCEVLESPASKFKTDFKTLTRFTTTLAKAGFKDKVVPAPAKG